MIQLQSVHLAIDDATEVIQSNPEAIVYQITEKVLCFHLAQSYKVATPSYVH